MVLRFVLAVLKIPILRSLFLSDHVGAYFVQPAFPLSFQIDISRLFLEVPSRLVLQSLFAKDFHLLVLFADRALHFARTSGGDRLLPGMSVIAEPPDLSRIAEICDLVWLLFVFRGVPLRS